jgi:hypothetical protein
VAVTIFGEGAHSEAEAANAEQMEELSRLTVRDILVRAQERIRREKQHRAAMEIDAMLVNGNDDEKDDDGNGTGG